MAFILRSVATTTATVVAASAILNAIAFSSSSSSSPTNLEPQSLNFSRPSPRGLGLARSFASSPMTTVPASDSSNLSQVLVKKFQTFEIPTFQTEFMVDMKCEGCVNAVKSKLETIEGIEKVDMDLANQVVRILGSSPVKTMSLALEQTSRKARLIGQGVPQDFLVSAAVAEFKGPDIFGVVRFAQVSMELARIEANFTGLSPGNHSWSINEYGDLTNGAASTGNLYNPFQDPTITEPLGDLGTLEADQSGEAFYSGKKEKLKVADLIGRALVVYKTEDKKSGPGLTAAVIARSAGVGENYKKLCTCDGTVIWEATNSDFVTSSV
ncbi:copper chaperone for superoxide dismutase, chloroplastic/cytosolic isoform X1 [Brassica napus]|uniref:copper chaperone for superoxide dismutase, chloroplastic/cytosolic isoform X1 n=1 Tax=Brassica napus TaxID=3708 RepID=UPI000BBF0050|nr:copper chaperone for superoxide dismutase, chloroplastic/cytosolic isoform X1 [Brassica napus]